MVYYQDRLSLENMDFPCIPVVGVANVGLLCYQAQQEWWKVAAR